MRIACKSGNDIAIFETNNITFSSEGCVFVRIDGVPLNVVRFGLREGIDYINELKTELLSNGYLDLTKLDIEYYDDWDHRFYKEGEKEKLRNEQATKLQQEAVLSEVDTESGTDK